MARTKVYLPYIINFACRGFHHAHCPFVLEILQPYARMTTGGRFQIYFDAITITFVPLFRQASPQVVITQPAKDDFKGVLLLVVTELVFNPILYVDHYWEHQEAASFQAGYCRSPRNPPLPTVYRTPNSQTPVSAPSA